MKEKIYIKCFLSKNFGDDLFLKILCDRYDQKFYLYSSLDYPMISSNLEVRHLNFINRIIRKSFHILKLDNLFQFLLAKDSDKIIVIGGSLFIEKTFDEFNLYKLYGKSKKYYIIGSNVGPFYSNKFIDKIKDTVFLNAQDVCLRDKNSYNLFNELENVRYAPDIVYSYDFSKYFSIKEKNKVFISVINPLFKQGQIKSDFSKEYENIIVSLINYFKKINFEILLCSFCEAEGDKLFIEKLLSKIDNTNVKTCFYNGNIELIINEIASSKIIIGSRFHANVVGFALNKVVVPISYNNKTKNMLNDIGFKGNYIDLDNLKEFKGINSINFSYKLDVKKLKKLSVLHFEKLDKIIKRKIDNE